MKNPFLERMPTTLMNPTSWMSLLQEQQMDAMQTSMAALSCRDPMALVSLQQAFMQRTLQRWTTADHGAAKPVASGKPAPKPAAAPVAMPKAVADAVDAQVEAVKAALAKVEASAAPAAVDDLTAIKGIGPKFAATLAEHGITSFRRLAGLSAAEIEALEEKLGFSGRFAREGWVEQAKALAAH